MIIYHNVLQIFYLSSSHFLFLNLLLKISLMRRLAIVLIKILFVCVLPVLKVFFKVIRKRYCCKLNVF